MQVFGHIEITGSHLVEAKIKKKTPTTKVQVELYKAKQLKEASGHPYCSSNVLPGPSLGSEWDYSGERQGEREDLGCLTSFSSHCIKLPNTVYFGAWHSSRASSQADHVWRCFWLLKPRGRCSWHLEGMSQGCCFTCSHPQAKTHSKEPPRSKDNEAKGENWCKVVTYQ